MRSDGRRFIANVGAPDFVRKDDVWQCFFFPRGGPEWENITVSLAPFRDIKFSHKTNPAGVFCTVIAPLTLLSVGSVVWLSREQE